MICLILHEDLEKKEICKKKKKKFAPVSSTEELLLSCTSQWSWHTDQPLPKSFDMIWYDTLTKHQSTFFITWSETCFQRKKLKGNEDITNDITPRLNTVPLDAFRNFFMQLLERCKKCTVITGDYLEGKWNSSVLISCSCYSIYIWTWCHHILSAHSKKRKASRPCQE